MTWWQIALLAFLAVGAVTIVVTGVVRLLSGRARISLQDPFEARYGSVMAGNWVPPLRNDTQIAAEETLDDGPTGHEEMGRGARHRRRS